MTCNYEKKDKTKEKKRDLFLTKTNAIFVPCCTLNKVTNSITKIISKFQN